MRFTLNRLLFSVIYDRKGVSALEYAILGGIVLAAVGAGLSALSGDIKNLFNQFDNVLTNAAAGS